MAIRAGSLNWQTQANLNRAESTRRSETNSRFVWAARPNSKKTPSPVDCTFLVYCIANVSRGFYAGEIPLVTLTRAAHRIRHRSFEVDGFPRLRLLEPGESVSALSAEIIVS
jgi:hypothetical protein